jgi:hypothetical protein
LEGGTKQPFSVQTNQVTASKITQSDDQVLVAALRLFDVDNKHLPKPLVTGTHFDSSKRWKEALWCHHVDNFKTCQSEIKRKEPSALASNAVETVPICKSDGARKGHDVRLTRKNREC